MESPITIHREIFAESHVASAWKKDVEGVRILALHGFTGSGLDWAPIAARLDRSFLAPDLLGHGASPAPEDWRAYRVHRVVSQCLDWCGLDSDWVVMGYSMGGRVALRLAPLLGDRLKGLVLISASPGIQGAKARAERMAQDAALAGSIERFGADWFSQYWSERPIIQSQKQIPESVRASMLVRRKSNRPVGLAGSLRGMGQGAVDPVWSTLGDLDVPCLVISGEQDVRYTEIATKTTEKMNDAMHVSIPNVGHCAHLEAIDLVSERLQDFISSIG